RAGGGRGIALQNHRDHRSERSEPMNRLPAPWHLGWGLAVAALLSGPCWAQADTPAPDCYILSVGMDNYPRRGRLRRCLHDARHLAAQFVAQQGKRFGKVHARVLLDALASREAVTTGMAALADAARPGDFAVLCFSGHGGRTPQRDWFFLPHDYDGKRHDAT